MSENTRQVTINCDYSSIMLYNNACQNFNQTKLVRLTDRQMGGQMDEWMSEQKTSKQTNKQTNQTKPKQINQSENILVEDGSKDDLVKCTRGTGTKTFLLARFLARNIVETNYIFQLLSASHSTYCLMNSFATRPASIKLARVSPHGIGVAQDKSEGRTHTIFFM